MEGEAVLEIVAVTDSALCDIARQLFREYASTLGFDLAFQHFDHEVGNLFKRYPPGKGVILLAKRRGQWVGCVAARPFEHGLCEMKRLYVRPEARGEGIGRHLAEAVIQRCRAMGYSHMRLDTVGSMTAAMALYKALGFTKIPPYRYNPQPDAVYYELDLKKPTPAPRLRTR